MNEKALRVLEFDKIINRLEQLAGSAPGKLLCRHLVPSDDLTLIRQLQQETTDALSRILRSGSVSFAGTADLRGSLKRLEVGAALNAGELLAVCKLLDAAKRVKAYSRDSSKEDRGAGAFRSRAFSSNAAKADRDAGTSRSKALNRDSATAKADRDAGSLAGVADDTQDSLDPLFSALSPLAPLAADIHRCVLAEDEIADDASPKLRQIRRSMEQTHERVRSVLAGMVNGSARTYLQDAVITQRNGRFCLPVKAEHRGQVPGMIHDQSSTGSTLFIEPMAVVKLNNDLRELELQEQKEIDAILASLSQSVAEELEAVMTNISVLTQLDFIFARAMLSRSYNGFEPEFNTDGIVNIRKGRHPLLDPKKVVPVDIRVGDGFDLLVISGPNTGGKTVSLKTAGLFSLMGQAGLHIPAAEHSSLCVFTEVFADIGDEQSIEQSLSTFSSHMKNIVSFWEQADEHSLVLFDELGAGTDPTEGAALAIAILSDLHARGIRTIATTHYSELKLFALDTPGVENACCEFNVETLRPTYRLLIGVPGKSNAFAISSRLGLPDYIIEDARSRIGQEAENFEDVVAGLEDSRRQAEEELELAKRQRQEAERILSGLEHKQTRLDEGREKILIQAREEARQILKEAKDYADETIRIYNKLGASSGVAREMERERGALREKISALEANMTQKTAQPKKEVSAKSLKLGDSVRIVSMNLKGTVSSLPDAKGNLYVQCGILRTQTNVKDLEPVEDPADGYGSAAGKGSQGGKGSHGGRTGFGNGSGSKSSSGKIRMSKSASVGTEINLLGKTTQEALIELDKYMDDAYMAHLPSVRIVHGKGTGALRKAVHDYLRRQKHVANYRLGEFGEGDSGVTIATFK